MYKRLEGLILFSQVPSDAATLVPSASSHQPSSAAESGSSLRPPAASISSSIDDRWFYRQRERGKPGQLKLPGNVRGLATALVRLADSYRTRILLSSLTGYLHKSNAGDKNTKISSLILHCNMEDRYADLIDKLISIAICGGVEHLDLETNLYYAGQRPSTAPYKFPFSLFTGGNGLSLTKLILGECTLNIPLGFAGFKSLVELSFTLMDISEDMIQTLIENCPNLECFYLSLCRGASHLKIASPHLQLREIVVKNCLQIRHIELVAPKLQQFTYKGPCISVVLCSVPLMEHACLDYEDSRDGKSVKYILGKLSQDFSLLTSLSIVVNTYRLKDPVILQGPPTAFKNLKSLTLNVVMYSNDDVAWAAILLELAPALESFQIELLTNDERKHPGGVVWEPSDFEHHHLRQVKFYRFRIKQRDVALAGLLLARAPLLQTMTFSRGFVHHLPGKGSHNQGDDLSAAADASKPAARGRRRKMNRRPAACAREKEDGPAARGQRMRQRWIWGEEDDEPMAGGGSSSSPATASSPACASSTPLSMPSFPPPSLLCLRRRR
uniref:At1g61320/AtMIF1 LRR domain-containing protein n=1 Tax=Leersia perrieri TaxID=77586 RepID=A0A0D9X076_9ORYZ